MYKVFFNDRTVFIGTKNDQKTPNEVIISHANNAISIQAAISKFLNDSQNRNLLLISEQLHVPHKLLKPFFKVIKASGGLVFNSQNQLLCIKRWGKWDLPKGKIDKGEKKKEAALREVMEETGISSLILNRKETVSYHVYQSGFHNNEWVLKTTYWYSMECKKDEEPVPQTDEGITEVKWFSFNDINTIVIPNTYQSLLSVFSKALLIVK